MTKKKKRRQSELPRKPMESKRKCKYCGHMVSGEVRAMRNAPWHQACYRRVKSKEFLDTLLNPAEAEPQPVTEGHSRENTE